MPEQIIKLFDKSSSTYNIDNNYNKYITDTNVLYMTRIQEERFKNKTKYNELANSYNLTLDDLNKCNKDIIILHPLPRVNEISRDVDSHPAAKYFAQAKYGMYLRMALLNYVFGKL